VPSERCSIEEQSIKYCGWVCCVSAPPASPSKRAVSDPYLRMRVNWDRPFIFSSKNMSASATVRYTHVTVSLVIRNRYLFRKYRMNRRKVRKLLASVFDPQIRGEE
jgi:hypothetical protein